MNTELFQKFSIFEDELIKKYNEHSFYKKIDSLSNETFRKFVIQIGFVSFEFVKFLERAKFPFENEAIREAARHILRDEIPVDGPTHQDNRISDLRMLGFTLDEILNTPATNDTKKTIDGYYSLVKYPQENYDLKVLTAVRVIGEVLVGETYRHVVEQMVKRFGLNPDKSLFYTFHWKHDQKGGTGDAGGEGHTEYYDKVMQEMLTDEAKLQIAKDSAQKAFQVRCDFHNQFLN